MVLFCMKDNTNTNTNTTTMTHQSCAKSHDQIDIELKKPHQLKDNNIKEQKQQEEDDTNIEIAYLKKVVLPIVEEEESGRERLKRHRVEMAGRVWIPDMWGQEEYLKDWIDCTTFDPPLISNSKIVTARTALVQEATRIQIPL